MHIPFVVVDAYQKEVHRYSDVGVDNIEGVPAVIEKINIEDDSIIEGVSVVFSEG